MINFRKKKPWIIKNPKNQKFRKYPLNAWKNAWKHENKTKKRDRIVLLALREENLAKIMEENEKKIVENPCQVRERRKVEKLFEKDVFETVQALF